MKAKKRAIFIIIWFVCLFVIWTGILCIFAFALPAQYTETYLGEMKYKVSRLRNTDGKRIIVIGGSSVAFGQDSELIENHLRGYSVVNFGLYGDLGTKLMLDIAESEIRDGDIVIISPEQDRQTLSLFFSGKAFWQAADGCFDLLSALKNDDIGSVIGAFPEFAAKKAAYRKSCAPVPDDIYRRASFNEYGDIGRGLRPNNILQATHDVMRPVSFDASVIADGFIEYLNGFADKMTARGANVYYRLCPVNNCAVAEDASAVDAFYDYLNERLNFSILGNPHNSIMDAGYFYDSNFHLNDSGVVFNTYNIIRDIKIVLRNSTATDIVVPPPPEIPVGNVSGDNSDADMFLYEDVGGTLTVTGLTDAGRTREKLIVPTEYNGISVTGFTSDAFNGASSLKTLVVQENVRMINDRSFDDCVALERLILMHSAPGKCVVGDDLFGSAGFNVYVPSDLLHSYKVNYFWSVYANRIYAFEEAE